LWTQLDRHTDEDALKIRLMAIASESAKPDISYDDWVMLDRIERRLEGKLQHNASLIDGA
jgi:hypothetical protein